MIEELIVEFIINPATLAGLLMQIYTARNLRKSIIKLNWKFTEHFPPYFFPTFLYDNYLDRIFIPESQVDILQNREHIIIKKTNPSYHRKLDNAILELTMNNNKVRHILFRKEFLVFMLYTDFWKGNKCSNDYSNHILEQINYINKTRPELKNSNKEAIDYAF